MFLLVFFCGLAASASSYPNNPSKEYVLTEQESLMHHKPSAFDQKYLTDTRITKTAQLSDFRIYLYTNRNRNKPVVVINNDVENVMNSGFFNSSARIISITHGWNNDYKSDVNAELTAAILDNYDVNIFVSGWGAVANQNYFTAKAAIPKIGQYLGEFINKFVVRSGVSYKQFTLIGHSLGAHIAGAAGSTTEQKVDLIIGLDPAFPLITYYDIDGRLDPTDADFVHVIHTCVGYLGFFDPIGHADYYPNGGENFQPGCFLDVIGSCSHGRSYVYLADSITNFQQKFWSFECDKYDSFKKGKCFDNELSFMGTIEPDRSANGKYFLQTGSEPPFAIDYNPFEE